MNVGIVGCGYVADFYLSGLANYPDLVVVGVTDLKPERSQAIREMYGTPVYESADAMLADPEVDLVINLTDPESHHEVTRSALLAGKHVYSEKPLATDLADAQELVDLAEKQGLLLSGAPCNVLSDSMQTMHRAIRDGAIGEVHLVYAEFDDNPIYLMEPEGWRSRSGAPWPYENEYEHGCTVEHAGYHLSWLVAMFGPATSVTAFSKRLVEEKTASPASTPDSADFSVACIVFESGVVARLTCSIVAPLDHRMRVIGREGVLTVETYRHYRAPVLLERFNTLTLNARKARSVRTNGVLQRLLGVRGTRQELIRRAPPPPRPAGGPRAWIGQGIGSLRLRELGAQDKALGVAEMAAAIREGRPCLLPPDFLLHVTELTLAIQNAGTHSSSYVPVTTCAPIGPAQPTLDAAWSYRTNRVLERLAGLAGGLLARLHRH